MSDPAELNPAEKAAPHKIATPSTKLFFGVGSVAFGIKESAFGYFLLIYYNQVLGLDPFLTGAALAVAMAVDAMADLGVGYWSDHFRSAWGRRHPFMYAALIPIGACFFFLWNPPEAVQAEQDALFIYLTCMAVLVRFCVTFFEVPNASMGPELSNDYDDRTRLSAFRYGFGWLGGLTIGVLSLMVLFNLDPAAQLGPIGYEYLGLVGALAMMGVGLVSALGTHRHIPTFYQPEAHGGRTVGEAVKYVSTLFTSVSFRAVFFAALFLGAATGLSQALMVYVNTFFWGLSTTQIGYLPLLGVIAVPTSFLLAPRLAERFGKKHAAIGLFLFAILFLPVPYVLALAGWFPPPDSSIYVPLIMLYYLVETSAIISMQIVFGSMNSDLVEDRSVQFEGQRDEGLIFAARNFCKKVVSGSGILLAGGVLWMANFPENATVGGVEQDVLRNLILLFLPALMGLYLLSCWCLNSYAIDRQQHQRNLESLRAN
ncbi:MAG: MFS transporter [Pseudomonadota bacterium]